ncbi:uncharacterized protein LOC124273068 [Haliotis rubra]|uniref:uncharacterized protein LOC124273068 n=1 Tax=Haliotis rubra TaxID=36100 RepID=UPI001EE563C0|nr:uncharacterized protein LOC124273068 [Haliotis rubra]XP_046564237.1 uncharacterized protein LOC124273068 [Haliotis rubra]
MSLLVDNDDTCIFVGGLRRDLPPHELKGNLTILFTCLGLGVGRSLDIRRLHIDVINNKKTDYCYAFVDLQHVDTVKYVLHRLSSETNRAGVNFHFTSIQDPYKHLKVEKKKPPKQPPRRIVDRSHNGAYSGTEPQFSLADKVKKLPFSSPTHQGNHAQTSTKGLAKQTSKPVLPPLESVQVSMATSVSGLGPNAPKRFYHYRETLGNETRTAEFKQGGFVASEHILQETIGKYVCGFLNTNGGTLFIGVDNDGYVVGVVCNQQDEDKHRLSIDHAIKSISPTLLPNLYTVDFVPVLDKANSFSSNLKVLEVKVKDPDDHGELYLYHGEAFLRRDGSIQMLKAREVRDWERQKREKSQEGREEVMVKLMEKTNELQDLQKQMLEVVRRNKKSNVCSVM